MFQNAAVPILYLIASVLFILGIKGLTRVRTARRGNLMSSFGMLLAVVATLIQMGIADDYRWILGGIVVGGGIGLFAAVRVQMTGMPEMVALFNGCGGVASALVGLSVVWTEVVEPERVGTTLATALQGGAVSAATLALGVLIGGITFSGSLVAWAKLAGKMGGQPILLPGRHALNLLLATVAVILGAWLAFVAADLALIEILAASVFLAALILGVLLVIPIGGADMPVVISLLNSYSGIAAAMTGFVIGNNMLIIAGALVGASGLILTRIMCDAMNRSLANVLFGGFGGEDSTGGPKGSDEYGTVRSYSAEDAALVLETAESVIFVPGYGLAVAQAQHTVKELASLLESRGVDVAYAIHPVAGRMPGHMNVLLAEADVPYEQLQEMDRINPEFKNTDVAIVVGANDVVNPAAETPDSPIYGMPVLEVWEARSVLVIKRSLSPGFAGIKNELFEYDNTMMLFADAKRALQDLVGELKRAAAA